MRYLLLCYDDAAFWQNAGPAVMDEAMKEAVQLAHTVNARGQYLTASPLQPTSTARSVRVRDGQRVITDGPFAETREVLGGFYLIDVPTLEEAVDIAARHPGARVGTVEVRPLLEISGLPRPLDVVTESEWENS